MRGHDALRSGLEACVELLRRNSRRRGVVDRTSKSVPPAACPFSAARPLHLPGGSTLRIRYPRRHPAGRVQSLSQWHVPPPRSRLDPACGPPSGHITLDSRGLLSFPPGTSCIFDTALGVDTLDDLGRCDCLDASKPRTKAPTAIDSRVAKRRTTRPTRSATWRAFRSSRLGRQAATQALCQRVRRHTYQRSSPWIRRRIKAPVFHAAPDRQLRQLHLQPRPVPGRAGRGRARPSQRRDHARADRGVGADADRDLAGAVHAERSGHLGAADPALRRQDPDPRRVPRPPGDRPGVRRHDRPRGARDARQGVAGHPRRPRRVRRPAVAADRDALPFARDRARDDAGVPRGHRDRRRRRDHGRAPSRVAVEGVQFHPEAILTEHGHALLRNFLEGRR